MGAGIGVAVGTGVRVGVGTGSVGVGEISLARGVWVGGGNVAETVGGGVESLVDIAVWSTPAIESVSDPSASLSLRSG